MDLNRFIDTMGDRVMSLEYVSEVNNGLQLEHLVEEYEMKERINWQEHLTLPINLEDELSNSKTKLVLNSNGTLTAAGQPIEFKLNNYKQWKPHLAKIQIKGRLLNQLYTTLTATQEGELIVAQDQPAIKYVIQYGTRAIVIIKTKRWISFTPYASHKDAKPVYIPKGFYLNENALTAEDLNQFPEVELNMLDEALELHERLEDLIKRSHAVANAMRIRTDDRIANLQEELEEANHRLEVLMT